MTDEPIKTAQETPPMGDTKRDRQAELYAALAAAQGQFKPIIQDRKVDVRKKDTGAFLYAFRYATLGAVLDATREALAANGLAIFCPISDNAVRVVLTHSGGGSIESAVTLQRRGDWQAFGSDVTYIRRYLVSAMLNVASEWDDDGNASRGQEAVPADEPVNTLWDRLDAAGVPTESKDRRAWCERVLGRALPNPDAISDVDAKLLLDVAEKRAPMPPEKGPLATEAQQKALNAAVDKLAPWGGPAALDGLDNTRAAAKRKNAKLAWASAMLEPPRRIAGFSVLSGEECDTLLTRALAGEMPAGDPLPAWMDTQTSPQGTAK